MHQDEERKITFEEIFPDGKTFLLGPIVGDISGCGHEPFQPEDRNFPLFTKYSQVSDDSILTIAVANALVKSRLENLDAGICTADALRIAVRKWPDSGYGFAFRNWALAEKPEPAYGSWANGSAMRVGACAWIAKSIDEAEQLAMVTSAVTHNHPLAMGAAKTIAALTYLARTGEKRDELLYYVQSEAGYDLSDKATDWHMLFAPDAMPNDLGMGFVRADYSAARSVRAFIESESFEDCIRKAVGIGGDMDTQGAQAGSIAEAFYGGVPEEFAVRSLEIMPQDLAREFAAAVSGIRQLAEEN